MQLKGVSSNVKRQLQLGIFLFTVFAAVHLLFFIGQAEYLVKLLLDRSDASWVLTLDYVGDGFWKCQLLFLDNFTVSYYVDSDIVVYKA